MNWEVLCLQQPVYHTLYWLWEAFLLSWFPKCFKVASWIMELHNVVWVFGLILRNHVIEWAEKNDSSFCIIGVSQRYITLRIVLRLSFIGDSISHEKELPVPLHRRTKDLSMTNKTEDYSLTTVETSIILARNSDRSLIGSVLERVLLATLQLKGDGRQKDTNFL